MPPPDDHAGPAVAPPPLSREELIALITRTHQDSAYEESSLAGRTLAAQSKLPKVIAENLGAGLGQWDFFPDASEIVDFAFAYAPPQNEEELWTLARAWASDDAAARHTLMTLVGREILLHELRRIEIPTLRAMFEEERPTRARELRESLGLAVAPLAAAKTKGARSKPSAVDPGAAKPAAAPVERAIPTRMPKPDFKPPPKPAAAAEAKRFQHPKFGEGVLQSQDGVGVEAKLTIKFASGSKTLLARYVTELPT